MEFYIIGFLSKIRYYISPIISVQLYYSLIYPFMTYGLLVWGNSYLSTIKTVTFLQNKAVRVISFSRYDEYTSLIFKSLNIIKFANVIYIHNAFFMYQFNNRLLPTAFINFFQSVSSRHSYNTRLASKST